MKQLTFLFSLLFSLALSATEVDLQKATNIAKSFGESNNLQIPLSHQTTHVIESNTQTLAWVFSSENNGFIAVAADLRVSPVVAYNDSGSFETGSPLYLLLKADLAHRLKHIGSQRQPAAQRVKRDWEVLLTGTREDYDQWPEPGSTSTGGWIETFWHQQHPFNKFAPINLDTGERSLTGCPATAIAQILNYHQTTNNTRFSQDDRYYHNYMQQFWIDDDWETYDFISFDSLNIYLDRIDDAFYSDAGLTEDMKAALSLAAGFASKTETAPLH